MTGQIGSLCSGYGGLDLAAAGFFDADVVWHVEYDTAPSKILAHHYPDVPNYGDVTAVDWTTMPPVDVLTGGYPCQPFSAAGRRKGTDDERHLWPYVREAIRVLRPRVVLLENVAGHRSLGFDRVLGDMAEDGLDVRWTSIRASDIGAPHHRERLFILATPADAEGQRQHDAGQPGERPTGHPGADCGLGVLPDAEVEGLRRRAGFGNRRHPAVRGETVDRPDDDRRPRPARRDSAPADADCVGRGQGSGQPSAGTPEVPAVGSGVGALPGHGRADDLLVLPTPRAMEAEQTMGSPGAARHVEAGNGGLTELLGTILPVLPTPTTSEATGNKGPDSNRSGGQYLREIVTGVLPTPNASDASGGGLHPDHPGRRGHTMQLPDYVLLADDSARWGKYAPAIHRWEHITRPSPSPTEPNKNGRPRLAAAFAEWMMGLPAGWVTDPAIGISRADQLKAIGNGVCPPQALAALHALTSMEVAA